MRRAALLSAGLRGGDDRGVGLILCDGAGSRAFSWGCGHWMGPASSSGLSPPLSGTGPAFPFTESGPAPPTRKWNRASPTVRPRLVEGPFFFLRRAGDRVEPDRWMRPDPARWEHIRAPAKTGAGDRRAVPAKSPPSPEHCGSDEVSAQAASAPSQAGMRVNRMPVGPHCMRPAALRRAFAPAISFANRLGEAPEGL